VPFSADSVQLMEIIFKIFILITNVMSYLVGLLSCVILTIYYSWQYLIMLWQYNTADNIVLGVCYVNSCCLFIYHGDNTLKASYFLLPCAFTPSYITQDSGFCYVLIRASVGAWTQITKIFVPSCSLHCYFCNCSDLGPFAPLVRVCFGDKWQPYACD
jgi:hypothetical protein